MLLSDEAARWASAPSPGRKVSTLLLLLLLAHARVGAADGGAPDALKLDQFGCDACSGVLSACMADDDGCVPYTICIMGCTDTRCLNQCAFRYSNHRTVLDLNACVVKNQCLGPDQVCECTPPKRSAADVQRQVALNTLRGTYDVVYGLNPEFNCLPGITSQYRFSLDPPAKPKGRPFNTTNVVDFMNVTTVIDEWAGSMDPTTGAIPVSCIVTGFPTVDIWYVLDSVKAGQYWHVLIGICAHKAGTCFSGGIVLTKRLPKPFQGPLPASVFERFKRALVQTGWSEANGVSWEKGCNLTRAHA